MIRKKLAKVYKVLLKHKLLLTATVFLIVGFILGVFLLGVQWIGHDVRQECLNAQEQYQGTCVNSLSTLILDPRQKLRHRTQAVWALGQLGDSKAVPALEKLATRPECQTGTNCHYELQKALKLASGSLNLTAPFWRLSIAN